MAYESKIYIVSVSKSTNYGQVIAMFDLCKMPYNVGWKEIFNCPVDYEVYIDSGDYPTVDDRYGENLKDASLTAVIKKKSV